MNRMLKTLVISLSILGMLIIEPMSLLAVKKDIGHEVLNFAPTVDFELKDKKKVDIIVDVGSTTYTMDEVNSLINQHLKPQLQESGYDYQLHVEKSSEGKTRQYYALTQDHEMGSIFRKSGPIYYFDIETGQHVLASSVAGDGGSAISSFTRILEDERTLIYTEPNKPLRITEWAGFDSSQVRYGTISPVKNGARPTQGGYPDPSMFMAYDTSASDRYGYYTSEYTIAPDGRILMLSQRNTNSEESARIKAWKDYKQSVYAFTVVDLKDINQRLSSTEWKNHVQNSNNSPWAYPHTIETDVFDVFPYVNNSGYNPTPYQINRRNATTKFYVTNDYGLYITNAERFEYYESLDEYIESEGQIEPNFTYKKGYYSTSEYGYESTHHRDQSLMSYQLDAQTGDLIFKEQVRTDILTLSRFDKSAMKVITGTVNKDARRSSEQITAFADWTIMDDGTIAATSFPGHSHGAGVVLLSDVDQEPVFISKPDLRPEYLTGSIGDYLLFLGSTSKEAFLYKFNIHTEEYSIAVPYKNLTVFKLIWYPEYMVSKKRIMTDIMEEVPYRSDAEKFYVRLDHNNVFHLNTNKYLVNTINMFSKQNVNFIQIGNEKNEEKAAIIQSALSQDRMIFDIEELAQSLQQIGSYITERKEVDLHVLVAQSGQTKTAIETSVQNLIKELKVQNIIVTPHYHFGTTSSTLQQLYDKISWDSNKNQYVLFLNNAAMNELSDDAYLEGAVSTLDSNYAHYLQIGSTTNRSIAESLIALNEGKGKFYNGTSYSTYYANMKQYIIDTALKNPKRVKDVLVLQHDPVTNEYSAEINVNLFYDDAEKDRKRNERFRTTQDPTVYENHTGLMDGIGQYQEAPTTRFTKVGLYEMTMQAQDEPIANPVMSEYWKWSKDSFSMLRLYVHRAPVAKFSAVVQSNKTLRITDYSYDLDRYSRINHGLIEWEWKWKRIEDSSWTAGQITQLANNTDYFISLKVKDLDGAWSNETIQLVTTNPLNNPPVALFTIDPSSVSHRANATITDLSYDPDGDAIIKREWMVKKDGKEIWNKEAQPTKAQLQTAATSKGLNQLGHYELSLRVTDALGEVSEWHREWLEVVNYPPLANFEDIIQTDRDSLNKLINTTVEPDQDGDSVSYAWTMKYKDRNYSLGSTKNPQFTIKSYGLGKAAVGEWEVTLQARDPLGASSTLTKFFEVINHAPIARISSSPPYAYIDEKYSFTSNDDDPDSEDKSSLTYYWKLIPPSGMYRTFTTKDVSNIMFDEKGKHTMEHWAEDQLGARSEIAQVTFNVLNKLPIPDFTRTPITTYRNVDIDFKSLATDPDGWIEAYRYELLRNGQTPLTLSTDEEFTRSFSSIGTFDIRHTVTDNDGASASITKQIYIVNRAPKVVVTQPSGTSVATATMFNTLNPTIRWTMTDADNDPQVQYQLQLKNQNGAVLRTTAATTTANKQFAIPDSWLEEGPIYRVAVRAYDGYDWGEYSADKYFYILLNRPPTPGFTYTPTIIYEGDQLKFRHAVDDLDLDTLSVRYIVTAPDGQKSQYPSSTTYYQVSSNQYNSDAFSISNVMPGNYVIEQTVTDSKSEPVKVAQTIRVGKLGIVGQVTHTELWESNRNAYNESLPVGSSNQWLPQQFYSGERFMLSADTTLADHAETGSTTYAMKVTVLLHTTGTKTELAYEKDFQWSGSMWEESFNNLARGKHTFTFTVHYSNGVVKQNDVEIEIIGKASELAGVHRWK